MQQFSSTLFNLGCYIALVALGAFLGSRAFLRTRPMPWLGRLQTAALLLLIVTALLCLVPTAVAGNLPWRTAVDRTAPFADVLVSITGVPAVRVLFLATAFVGAVGVMNSTLYSSSRMLYGLARSKLVPGGFGRLHPRYGTPTRCVWFAAAFVLPAPFTGKLFFRPLIHVASLATIGLNAFVITITSMIGSMLAVHALRRWVLKLDKQARTPAQAEENAAHGGQSAKVDHTLTILIVITVAVGMLAGYFVLPPAVTAHCGQVINLGL